MGQVDLEDLGTSLLVRQSDLDDTVEPPGSEKSVIQDVGPVGCSDDLDVIKNELIECGYIKGRNIYSVKGGTNAKNGRKGP